LRGASTAVAPDLTKVLSGLAVYLPAEAIAAYTTVLAFAQGGSTSALWAVAVIVGVLSLLLTTGLSRRTARRAGLKFKVPVGDLLVVAFAFSIYAISMPGSAMWHYQWFTAAWAGAASVLGHFVLLIVSIWRET
jgi:hypothetical protein